MIWSQVKRAPKTYRSNDSSQAPGEAKDSVGAGSIGLVGDITNGAAELRCQLTSVVTQLNSPLR